MIYFIVGCRTLSLDPHIGRLAGYTHACILLSPNSDYSDGDLLEYDGEGVHIKKGVGKIKEFNWDELGCNLHGMSRASHQAIIAKVTTDPKWTANNYDIMSHNCHDYVQYVMQSMGVTGGMLTKTGICFTGPSRQPLRKLGKEILINYKDTPDWVFYDR